MWLAEERGLNFISDDREAFLLPQSQQSRSKRRQHKPTLHPLCDDAADLRAKRRGHVGDNLHGNRQIN